MPRVRNRIVATVPPTTSQRLASVVKSCRDIMRKDKGLNGELDRLPMLTWVMFLKFLDDIERIREDEARMEGKSFRPIIEAPYRWRDWNRKNTHPAADDGLHNAMTGDVLTGFITHDEATRADGTRGLGLFAYLRSLQGAGEVIDRRDVVATVFKETVNRMQSGYLLRDVLDKINEIHFTSSDEIHTLGNLYESMLKEMRDAAGDSGEFYTPRPVVRFMVQAVNPRLGETVLDPACGTGGFLVEAYRHIEQQCATVADRVQLQRHSLFGGEEERGILSNFPDDRQTAETAVLFLQLLMRKLRRVPKPGRAAVVVPNTTLFYSGVAARVRQDLLEQFNLTAIVRLPKGVFEPYTDIETNILFFDASGPTTSVLYYRLPLPAGRRQYTKTQPVRFEEFAECLSLLTTGSDDSSHAWRAPASSILRSPNADLDLHNPKDIRTTAEPPAVVLQKLTDSLTQVVHRLSALDAPIASINGLLADRSEWVDVRLGDVLRRRRDVVDVEAGVTYKRLRIQVKGRGILLRDEVDGSVIGTKRQFSVRAGQFVLSKIDARNGAFGILPDECDGAIITGNFWAYDIDEGVIQARLLHYLTFGDAFLDFCAVSSPGATNRRYLQEDRFLNQVTRVPARPLDQERLAMALDLIAGAARAQEAAVTTLKAQIPALLQASLHAVFGGSERVIGSAEDEVAVENADRDLVEVSDE